MNNKGILLLLLLCLAYRRSLSAQHRARAKEVMAQTKTMQSTLAIGKTALQVTILTIHATTCIPLYSNCTIKVCYSDILVFFIECHDI